MSWEYHIETMTLTQKIFGQAKEFEKFRARLNELGNDNWEMVSYDAIPLVGSFNTASIKSYAYLAIFKRIRSG